MALTNTAAVVKATATASQTVFDISDITFYATTDIIVYANGSLVASGYTVDVDNQTVTFDTGRTAGDLMVFQRVLPRTQEKTYTVQGKFPAASHENGLDRGVALIQEVEEELDRTIQIPVTNTATSWDGSIPDPGLTANKGRVLRIKTDGTGIETLTVDTSDTLNVLTTEGDLINGGTNGVAQRLAKGSTGSLLYGKDSVTGDLAWSTAIGTNQVPYFDGTDITPQYVPDNALANSTVPFNFGFTATLSTNDLVITLTSADGSTPSATNPVWFPFRSATAISGVLTWDKMTATETLTLPSTGTLNATASEQIRAYIYAMRNGSDDIELCIARQALWSGDTLQSTTAIGTGSDDNATLYSTTARTDKPIMLVGVIEITSTSTPGQWTTVDNVAVWKPGMKKTGDIVQRIYLEHKDNVSTTSTIPSDDTAPQSTEGAVAVTLSSITPTSGINTIGFDSIGRGTNSGINYFMMALFKDSETDAIAWDGFITSGANFPVTVHMHYEFVPGSTSAIEFKPRFGSPSGTAYYNYNGGALSDQGDTWYSSYCIQEVYV